MATPLSLSVIVPVGPGELAWRDLLGDLAALAESAEVILVAPTGESPVDFCAADHGLELPVRWLEAPRGRARQQNAGAAAARGNMLWFLHSDSRLPADTVRTAQNADAPNSLGYFDLRFRGDGPSLVWLNSVGARIRSRWLRLPFGDQGLLLSRRLFHELGGFDESLACGEDHALVWSARRAGVPLIPLEAPLFTSARRYREEGWLRTTLRHARLTIGQARAFSSRAEERPRP